MVVDTAHACVDAHARENHAKLVIAGVDATKGIAPPLPPAIHIYNI